MIWKTFLLSFPIIKYIFKNEKLGILVYIIAKIKWKINLELYLEELFEEPPGETLAKSPKEEKIEISPTSNTTSPTDDI